MVCHASAWDVDNEDDLRIKMCIEITAEDFTTIHHELGHNFYQRAYKHQPFLFRDSANDGFHEAIGDAIALSITPAYLKQIGFSTQEPDPSKDLGLLMQMALDKVAFLPFGLLIDQWRWKVFSGEVPPASYNEAWWELRQKYQGVTAPVARSEADFDPGAKYHVPANVPYTRYFLAHILQFQFHRALCQRRGYQGPLNRCSIYGSKEAGARLQKMLAMGLSRPWPDALEALTGQRQMDATRDPRLLRAAAEVARRAERRASRWAGRSVRGALVAPRRGVAACAGGVASPRPRRRSRRRRSPRARRGCKRCDGFLPFYWDAEKGQLLLEIARSARSSSTARAWPAGRACSRSRLDRGQLGELALVRFERVGPARAAPPAPDRAPQRRRRRASARAWWRSRSLRPCWPPCRSWRRTASACSSTPPSSCCGTPSSLPLLRQAQVGEWRQDVARSAHPLRPHGRLPAQHRDRGGADLHLRQPAAARWPACCPTAAP